MKKYGLLFVIACSGLYAGEKIEKVDSGMSNIFGILLMGGMGVPKEVQEESKSETDSQKQIERLEQQHKTLSWYTQRGSDDIHCSPALEKDLEEYILYLRKEYEETSRELWMSGEKTVKTPRGVMMRAVEVFKTLDDGQESSDDSQRSDQEQLQKLVEHTNQEKDSNNDGQRYIRWLAHHAEAPLGESSYREYENFQRRRLSQ